MLTTLGASRGCKPEDIVNVVTITAIQAIARKRDAADGSVRIDAASGGN